MQAGSPTYAGGGWGTMQPMGATASTGSTMGRIPAAPSFSKVYATATLAPTLPPTASMYVGHPCHCQGIPVPTGNVSKVTIISLDMYSGEDSDWMVKFSHAGHEFGSTLRRCAAGNTAVWEESFEFPVMHACDLYFAVDRVGLMEVDRLGIAVTPVVPGMAELSIAAHENPSDVRGKLRVLIGVKYPQAVPTLPPTTVVAAPVYEENASYSYVPAPTTSVAPTMVLPPTTIVAEPALRVEAQEVAVAPTASDKPSIEVEVQQMPQRTHMVASRTVLPPTLPASVSMVLAPTAMPTVVAPTMAPPMPPSMCKATVESFAPVEAPSFTSSWAVRLRYGAQEAATSLQTPDRREVVWNESIEFPVVAGQDLVLTVEDATSREAVGSAATQVVPGYWELHIHDFHGLLRGRLKLKLRLYSGPSLGAPSLELPVPVLGAPPPQMAQSPMAAAYGSMSYSGTQSPPMPGGLPCGSPYQSFPSLGSPCAHSPSFRAPGNPHAQPVSYGYGMAPSALGGAYASNPSSPSWAAGRAAPTPMSPTPSSPIAGTRGW